MESDFNLESRKPGEGKKIFRGTPVSLAGARGYAPDPVFEIAGNAPDHDAMTLLGPWIRFASPAKVEARSASDSPVDSLGPARG